MRVVVIYRPNSEHSRKVEEFLHDVKRFNGHRQNIELIDIDSPYGSQLAAIYGVMQYPTVMVLTDDGQVDHMWEGGNLPLINEVGYYARR